MIWPNLRIGAPLSMPATAILWPLGTRSLAVTAPSGVAPAGISSTATITLSEGSSRRARGVVIVGVPMVRCSRRKEIGLGPHEGFEEFGGLREMASHRRARRRRCRAPRSPRAPRRARPSPGACGPAASSEDDARARDGRGCRREFPPRAPSPAGWSGSGGTRRRAGNRRPGRWPAPLRACRARLAATTARSALVIRCAASAAISPSSALRMNSRSRTSCKEMRATKEPCCGATSTSRS